MVSSSSGQIRTFVNRTEICVRHLKTNTGHYLCRVRLSYWNLENTLWTNRRFCLKTAMNTRDINKVLRSDIFVRHVGTCKVLPRDQLLFIIDRTKKACFVINTDPGYKPGEHWVPLHKGGCGTWEYSDSFGNLNDILKLLISLRETQIDLTSITRGCHNTLVVHAVYMLYISC